ncbi:MAG TPA: hypothetical protein VFS42_10370 [Burkholderiaceae bacterium]|nr:hypothetical protein [Burkholderiaceae bacterium]
MPQALNDEPIQSSASSSIAHSPALVDEILRPVRSGDNDSINRTLQSMSGGHSSTDIQGAVRQARIALADKFGEVLRLNNIHPDDPVCLVFDSAGDCVQESVLIEYASKVHGIKVGRAMVCDVGFSEEARDRLSNLSMYAELVPGRNQLGNLLAALDSTHKIVLSSLFHQTQFTYESESERRQLVEINKAAEQRLALLAQPYGLFFDSTAFETAYKNAFQTNDGLVVNMSERLQRLRGIDA